MEERQGLNAEPCATLAWAHGLLYRSLGGQQFQELAGGNDLGVPILFGKVSGVAGDKVVGRRCLGSF